MASSSRSDNESEEDEDNELLPSSSGASSGKDKEGNLHNPGTLSSRTDDTLLSEENQGPSQESRRVGNNPDPVPGASLPPDPHGLPQHPSTTQKLSQRNTGSSPGKFLQAGKKSPGAESAPALINLIEDQPLMMNNNQEDKGDKIVAIFDDPPEAMEMEGDTDSENQCGIGRYRPPCLQKFANKGWMLFWMCWFCLVQGMLVNGLVPSVLSTIERRFDFQTSTLGRIMQFYDIGYVICCIPVSYFGGRHSKPFFIGLGLLIMGCGSFLFSMPHIVSEAYTTKILSTDGSHCLVGAKGAPIYPTLGLNSSSVSDSAAYGAVNVNAQRMCPGQMSPKVSDKLRYAFLFCFAHFLHGVGATPLFTLGVSYIDENVKPTLSSLYIGVFYAFAIFGPAIGFLLSGTFLRFHTDFLQAERQRKITEIDESDPHWVGAWWIGFQVASILSVLAVFPILSFPKVLPGAEKWFKARQRAEETKNSLKEEPASARPPPPLGGSLRSKFPDNQQDPAPSSNVDLSERRVPLKKVFSEPPDTKPRNELATASLRGNNRRPGATGERERGATSSGGSVRSRLRESSGGGKEESIMRRFFGDVRHIPLALKKLFLNPTFMFVNMAAAVDGLLITGLSSYMTKYLERQFNLPSSKSSMLQGCIMVPVAGLGTMASGYVVKRYRLTCQNTLKFCIVMVVFCLVLTPMFLVYCDHSPLVGLETFYPVGKSSRLKNGSAESLRLASSCNKHCECDKSKFRPVCAEIPNEAPLSYYSPCFAGCPEVYDSSRKLYSNCTCVPNKGKVKKGLCEAKCSGLIGFLVLFAPMVLCTFCVGVPALSVVLRCVDYNERSFALGLQWVLIRCIGTIPAQTIFAWLFDISCVRPITEDAVSSLSRPSPRCDMRGLDLGSCFVYDNKLLADLFLAFGLVGQTGTLLFFVLALVFYRRRPGREDPIEAEFR